MIHWTQTLKLLAKLTQDWNSYGATPPTRQALWDAEIVLEATQHAHKAPMPTITPTTDGGIEIEWSCPASELTLTIAPIPDFKAIHTFTHRFLAAHETPQQKEKTMPSIRVYIETNKDAASHWHEMHNVKVACEQAKLPIPNVAQTFMDHTPKCPDIGHVEITDAVSITQWSETDQCVKIGFNLSSLPADTERIVLRIEREHFHMMEGHALSSNKNFPHTMRTAYP